MLLAAALPTGLGIEFVRVIGPARAVVAFARSARELTRRQNQAGKEQQTVL